MFKSTFNRGFQMTFANGITISVQWGSGNYCDRRNFSDGLKTDLKHDVVQCSNAEIAIWDAEQVWFDFGRDQVKGWVDANEVATWITLVSEAAILDNVRQNAIDLGLIENGDDDFVDPAGGSGLHSHE
jgi:hypothetical protein